MPLGWQCRPIRPCSDQAWNLGSTTSTACAGSMAIRPLLHLAMWSVGLDNPRIASAPRRPRTAREGHPSWLLVDRIQRLAECDLADAVRDQVRK
jgi:hypothetical protein